MSKRYVIATNVALVSAEDYATREEAERGLAMLREIVLRQGKRPEFAWEMYVREKRPNDKFEPAGIVVGYSGH
jgi:hypothetical protein